MKFYRTKICNHMMLLLFAIAAILYAGTKPQRKIARDLSEENGSDENVVDDGVIGNRDGGFSGFGISSLHRGTNDFSVTFSIPFIGTLDVFGTDDLHSDVWDLIDSFHTRESSETIVIPNLTNSTYFVKGVLREIDRDDDGMEDSWEIANGLNVSDPADAYRDSDGDGLTDFMERNVWFTDSFCADFDNDGFSDGEEVSDGTDAFDPFSYKRFVTIEITDGFSLPGETNTIYVLTEADDFSTSLCNHSFVGAYTNTFCFPNNTNTLYLSLTRGVMTNAYSETLRASRKKATISVSMKFLDRDNDKIYDPWETMHGLSPSNRLDAIADNDNDGLLNIHEFWHDSDPDADDCTNSLIKICTRSIDSRLVVNVTSNELEMVLPKFSPYEENNFGINTNCWLHGIDTSCVSMWNDQEPWMQNGVHTTSPSQRSGVAISKRHVLQANHWAVGVNKHLLFYGTDGNVYTNKIIAARYVAGDIRVGLLETDLPDAVSIAQVMPTNFFDYVGNGYKLPVVYLDQKEEARMLAINEINFNDHLYYYSFSNTNELHKAYYKTPIGGDSGSPHFFLAGDIPVLIGVTWKNKDTTFAGFYVNEIQNAMDGLLPGEKSSHRLRLLNLDIYLNIKPERVKK